MRFLLLPALFVLLCLFFQTKVEAYPNFIGYGYNACATCHYSGQGGGALNDYGRALFATEIASRAFYAKNLSDEQIGAKSGFLGSRELPWWIRPGLKYRGLWLENNPGSGQESQKFYNMQNDLNLNFFLDPEQVYTLVTTFAYTTYPRQFSTSSEDKVPYWFAKEYYLRWQTPKENLWFYLGQMDKVFGLRLADHTAVNRSPIGLGQFDQSLGAILEWTPAQWNVAGNAFFGNADEKTEFKQKGFSASAEYEVYEKFRVGGSFLSSRSDVAEWTRLAGFTRMGLSKGSSVMAEVGTARNKSVSADLDTTGTYALLESWVLIQRGYNLLSTVEFGKSDIKSTSPERMRWGLGSIFFPLPRTEMRALFLNNKTMTPESGTPDSWQAQLQLHLSL